METALMIVATLSIVAFVVGMFSPETVKCSSRGKVALTYIGIFFISAILGSSLAEDGQTANVSEEQNAEREETSSQEKQQVEESAIGKPLQIGDFAYQVNSFSFKKSVGNEFMRETADGIYLLVDISIMNMDNESHTLDGSLFSVTDLEGREYEYSTNGSTALELSGYKTLFLKQCQPNIATQGILIFEVPNKDKYYLHLTGGFWSSKSARILLN